MNTQKETEQKSKVTAKTLDELLYLYFESMTIYEKIAYEIAKNDLESSYDMEKTIGFQNFLEKNSFVILK